MRFLASDSIVSPRVLMPATLCVVLLLLYNAGKPVPTNLYVMKESDLEGLPQANTNVDKQQDQALLVTFARSGSSFTSDLIAHHKDVFFTFEPLSSLGINTHSPKHKSTFSQQLGLQDYVSKALEPYLTCNFESGVDVPSTLGNIFMGVSNSTYQFYTCVKTKNSPLGAVGCYLQLVEKCRSHRMTFVKTIRVPVRWARELMVRNPRLKLLYLVRDPRAVLWSQAKVLGLFQFPKDLVGAAANHCEHLGQDLEDLRRLHGLFPGRVKVIRYEDGVLDPHTYAKKIYEFFGLSITQDLTDYVNYLTKPDKNNRVSSQGPEQSPSPSGVWPTTARTGSSFITDANSNSRHRERRAVKRRANFDTRRQDPLQAMQHSRHEMSIEDVRRIDHHCSHLYGKLGYKTVNSQNELNNTKENSLWDSPQLETFQNWVNSG